VAGAAVVGGDTILAEGVILSCALTHITRAQDESPDRAREREPAYKRLLSVELSRLLRAENDAVRTTAVRATITAAAAAADNDVVRACCGTARTLSGCVCARTVTRVTVARQIAAHMQVA
jgi:hypothetical protein